MNSKYIHNTNVHNDKAAREIIPYLLSLLPQKINSVADVGCGTGTWLKVFEEYGIKNILGIEGDHLDISKLIIDKEYFILKNLENENTFDRKFDLALSLEVAEHLKSESAEVFISTLVQLSDIIIFSAAIPNQGGQNHINEQLFSYWHNIFKKHEYEYYDIFRNQFWNNSNVDWWYRQNMFLVAKKGVVDFIPDLDPKLYIHPELFNLKIEKIDSENQRGGISLIKKGIKKIIQKYIK